MRHPVVSAAITAGVLALLPACPSSSAPPGTAPEAVRPAAVVTEADSGAATAADPGPAKTAAAVADAAPPAAPEWTPPVVPTTSPACGTGPTTIAAGKTYATPTTNRTFHVWAPAGYDRTKPWPVVVMFHGIETNGADFEAWFEMEKYVKGKAIVVYPDARSGAWDVSGTSDLAFYDAMMKQLGEVACIDPSHVLGFGFSWGAYFASYLGCKRAGWVKAVSAGDGGWGGATDCGRLPVLVTHRTADPDERIANGRANAALWTKIDQCTGGPIAGDPAMKCTAQKDCKAPGSVTFCEDTFVDPTWPSDWNHTVRETYRAYTWNWFAALP